MYCDKPYYIEFSIRRNGIYDFNKITDYEVLSVFSGAEDQIVSSFTRTDTRNGNYETLSHGDISPECLFPSYSWESIKNFLTNKFVFLDRICSIVIGVYTIFPFIKSFVTILLNCILLRKIGAGFLDVCKFTLSPSTYI